MIDSGISWNQFGNKIIEKDVSLACFHDRKKCASTSEKKLVLQFTTIYKDKVEYYVLFKDNETLSHFYLCKNMGSNRLTYQMSLLVSKRLLFRYLAHFSVFDEPHLQYELVVKMAIKAMKLVISLLCLANYVFADIFSGQ